MEQVAAENGVGLVAYTITHHTRQSAIGLPFIQDRIYDSRRYSVTEYTMSEIVASVYNKIEQTGLAGELVDYRIHEVLQAVGPDTKEQEGTVAKVYSQGMLYQGAVIRKARVAAYRKE